MRRQVGLAKAVAPVLVGILIVALNVAAIDGLPIGVELTNADVGTEGWIRVADDDGLEPQEFTIEAWVTPLGAAYSPTGSAVGARIVIKPMEGQAGLRIVRKQ
jgi:hypothetical protein